MKKLVIFGAGKLAELLAVCLHEDGQREIAAFTVDRDYQEGGDFYGKPLVAFDSLSRDYPPAKHDILVAIGYAEINKARQRAVASCKAMGYEITSYVSPNAILPKGFDPKPNTIIFEGSVVQRFVALGAGVIVWPNACICHHAVVEEYVFVAPGAVICGGTHIATRALIGAGAVIRDFLTVGEAAIVGAGSTLLRDLPSGALCNSGESPVSFDAAAKTSLWPPKTLRI